MEEQTKKKCAFGEDLDCYHSPSSNPTFFQNAYMNVYMYPNGGERWNDVGYSQDVRLLMHTRFCVTKLSFLYSKIYNIILSVLVMFLLHPFFKKIK